MDQTCAHCQQICKRLEPDDDPKHYLFCTLTPHDVISIIELVVQNYQGKFLHLIDTALSDGHQIAVMLKGNAPGLKDKLDECIVFVSQASYDADGYTDMWIRYGTPEQCCCHLAVVSELTLLVEQILDKLYEADRLSRDSHTNKI